MTFQPSLPKNDWTGMLLAARRYAMAMAGSANLSGPDEIFKLYKNKRKSMR